MDETQLELLIEDAYPRILRAALVLTDHRCEAEDLAQETFFQAIRSWPRLAGEAKTETWLYAILLNVHRKRLRWNRRRWRRWLTWFERSPRPAAERAASWRVEQVEWEESLWNAVKRLPPPQQHAVVLRYSEGLSYEQIADTLRCPVGTAKSRIHHAIATLRAMLAEDPDVPGPTKTSERIAKASP